MVTYQELGGGYKIPSVGLGTFTVTDEAVLEDTLNTALEAGYRHIDTASIYNNEQIIGRVLKKWFNSGKLKREDVFITTKLPPNGNHTNKVEFFLKKSLENLQTNYVDLYLIHFPIAVEFTSETPAFFGEPVQTDHIALWKELEKQVDAGRAKSIGISNFNLRQTKRIYDNARIKPACNQIELQPYLQEKELVKYCQENGIVITGYGSLGRGGLNEFYKKVGRPEIKLPALLDDENIKKIGANHKKTAAQVILRYFTQKNIVMIPKSVTPSRIRENFNIFDFSLNADEIKVMDGLDKGESGRITNFPGNTKINTHPEFPWQV